MSKKKGGLRDKLRGGVGKRTEESYARRDNSGRFGNIFRDDCEFNIAKIGSEAFFDIVPYLAGKNDPQLPEGEPQYVLELYVHYNVGPNQDAFVCPARTYGKACPICQERDRLRRQEADEDLVKSLNAKHRAIYYIIDYTSPKEEEKGVQIVDFPHYTTERVFSGLAKTPSRGGVSSGFIPFASPDRDGKTISFEKQGKGIQTQYLSHKFVDRDYDLDDEFLELAAENPLDEQINVASYQDIKDKFEQGFSERDSSPESPAEEEPPRRSRSTSPRRSRRPAPEPEEVDQDDPPFDPDDDSDENLDAAEEAFGSEGGEEYEGDDGEDPEPEPEPEPAKPKTRATAPGRRKIRRRS